MLLTQDFFFHEPLSWMKYLWKYQCVISKGIFIPYKIEAFITIGQQFSEMLFELKIMTKFGGISRNLHFEVCRVWSRSFPTRIFLHVQLHFIAKLFGEY